MKEIYGLQVQIDNITIHVTFKQPLVVSEDWGYSMSISYTGSPRQSTVSEILAS